MLIDQTYFKGDLMIAGLTKAEVSERLNLFIEKYEQEFLQDLFGYPLYKALIDGLSQVSVEQRWMDILEGAEFQYNSRTRKWKGLVILPSGQTLVINPGSQQVLIAGDVGTYDPTPGQLTLTLPPAFIGSYFIIERRGTGQLRPDEYTVVGNLLTLVGMPAWNNGETIFLSKNPSIGVSGAGTLVKSPIANYVYWHWIKDQNTQTVGMGEVSSKSENAINVSPATKMVRAWNEMSDWLSDLYYFMQTNYQTYPEWRFSDSYWSQFRKTNTFGI
jgi:hypothetical protein